VLSNLNIDDIAIDNPFEGKTSIKGKVWSSPTVDEARIEHLVQAHGLPEMVARLLVIRDLDKGDVGAFLKPTLAKNFPDPFSLQNMNETASFIATAIQENKKIGILADFDVDGATSYATLSRFLMAAGCANVPCFIPDRLNDGYGPSVKGFDSLKEQGAEIAIVLDCGITSVDPIAHAKSIGLEVVVVDHHEPDEILPNANFIINPKLADDTSGLDYLAAVGVTFLLSIAINAKLREADFYTD
jgi:single-stranded-DNA-specific exonuclease